MRNCFKCWWQKLKYRLKLFVTNIELATFYHGLWKLDHGISVGSLGMKIMSIQWNYEIKVCYNRLILFHDIARKSRFWCTYVYVSKWKSCLSSTFIKKSWQRFSFVWNHSLLIIIQKLLKETFLCCLFEKSTMKISI